MGIKIEVLKNEHETLNKDGYRIPPGYYYVINAIANEVLFFLKTLVKLIGLNHIFYTLTNIWAKRLLY